MCSSRLAAKNEVGVKGDTTGKTKKIRRVDPDSQCKCQIKAVKSTSKTMELPWGIQIKNTELTHKNCRGMSKVSMREVVENGRFVDLVDGDRKASKTSMAKTLKGAGMSMPATSMYRARNKFTKEDAQMFSEGFQLLGPWVAAFNKVKHGNYCNGTAMMHTEQVQKAASSRATPASFRSTISSAPSLASSPVSLVASLASSSSSAFLSSSPSSSASSSSAALLTSNESSSSIPTTTLTCPKNHTLTYGKYALFDGLTCFNCGRDNFDRGFNCEMYDDDKGEYICDHDICFTCEGLLTCEELSTFSSPSTASTAMTGGASSASSALSSASTAMTAAGTTGGLSSASSALSSASTAMTEGGTAGGSSSASPAAISTSSPDVDEAGPLLRAGDVILYNHPLYIASTHAARRETIVVGIDSGNTQFPLSLQNNEHLSMDQRLYTLLGPNKVRSTHSYELKEFKLIDGNVDVATSRESQLKNVSEQLNQLSSDFPQVRRKRGKGDQKVLCVCGSHSQSYCSHSMFLRLCL